MVVLATEIKPAESIVMPETVELSLCFPTLHVQAVGDPVPVFTEIVGTRTALVP